MEWPARLPPVGGGGVSTGELETNTFHSPSFLYGSDTNLLGGTKAWMII